MKLEARGLTFSYDGRRMIFKNISFSCESPEVLCILGANGTGKSTLLKCMIGQYKPEEGGMFVNGRNVREYSPRELARRIA